MIYKAIVEKLVKWQNVTSVKITKSHKKTNKQILPKKRRFIDIKKSLQKEKIID